jgi:signal transduction histidine kinase
VRNIAEMDRTQVTATRAAIRVLKDEMNSIPKYIVIVIPALFLLADTEYSVYLASMIDHIEDGNTMALNPKWNEINKQLSPLLESMSGYDREKKEKETVRLNKKAAKEAANKAAQEERDKAARENRDKKAREKRENAEQRKLDREARINPFAALCLL